MVEVSPWHWLEPDGSFPQATPQVWPKLIRMGLVIQLGCDLPKNHGRETLLKCKSRGCGGWMWVAHHPRGGLFFYCATCGKDEMLINAWQDTPWALRRGESEVVFP